jgi:hypothetical protein
MPEGIADRDADVWEALLAIADLAGGEWPERARVAAVTLVTLAKESTPSLGVKLLADLRQVFAEEEQVRTDDLLQKLHGLDESPWGDLKGKPLDSRGLARRLKDYGVKPATIRVALGTAKGYRRSDFFDAWSRYLPQPLGYVGRLSSSSVTGSELGASRYVSVTAVTSGTAWRGEAA